MQGPTSHSGVSVEPSPLAFSEAFPPDSLIDKTVEQSNVHAKSRLPPAKIIELTHANILHFFAIHCHVGLVKLPCEHDHWKAEKSV